eukprot:TRINITY_DN14214_c1_g1_i2.p1 TRINITY_DN14214_c1_g1~~TRINITY_DN14214_c1_g1_i2.p1  ORF type:complete len:783 (-),score=164.15 TRINITY_DN14214_c1_g1_i2:115-2442(-)
MSPLLCRLDVRTCFVRAWKLACRGRPLHSHAPPGTGAQRAMSSGWDAEKLRDGRAAELAKLAEVQQFDRFREQLRSGELVAAANHMAFHEAGLTPEMVRLCIRAGMATFITHVESRIASHLGYGFYTIGPCGEENLAALALALKPQDPLALHYRHLSTQVARQLGAGRSMESILLDRARGYTCSAQDPVTGGVHCSLGGGATDFIVTSTLASQAPAAVGRALGSQLAAVEGIDGPFGSGCVSVVSLGDGSVNNAHFLSAANLAEYAAHRGFKCPVLFVVSNNDICISLRSYGWLPRFLEQRLGMPCFEADGNDLGAVYRATARATAQVRRSKRPALLTVSNIKRQFGHAASDRQDAYLSAEEIQEAANHSPLDAVCARAVEEGIFSSWDEIAGEFDNIATIARDAFGRAASEPRLQKREEAYRVAPSPPMSAGCSGTTQRPPHEKSGRRSVMRKHMTRVLHETLESVPEAVYLGEDVRHGGYYLVTEGLAAAFPNRVQDFPPDETSLIGAAVGYAQAGLLPIVEIPYAKYLDCGADQFYEAAINYWLSDGKQPNGMIIRLQGFDRGVFGGNFHTHNMLSIPPGLDVVCFSNGADYVRGFRRALELAKAGRVVMTVDSTALLNQRHLHGRDDEWLTPYPEAADVLDFTGISRHGAADANIAIVTYGNGVLTALQAVKELEQHGLSIAVLDHPCLSEVSEGLRQALKSFEAVLFADVCKSGQNPLAGFICDLQRRGELPKVWQSTAAPFTYNPLGSTLTFLNTQDIVDGIMALKQLM